MERTLFIPLVRDCVPLAPKVPLTRVSGTTGKPKGVDVSHGNVTNLLTAAPGNVGIKPGTRVAQLLSVSFDMAAWEIFGTLMNGGTLHIRTSTGLQLWPKLILLSQLHRSWAR